MSLPMPTQGRWRGKCMSFTYLQELGGGFSAVCSTGIPLSEQLRLKNTLGKFLHNGSLTDVCQHFRSGMMYAHSDPTTQSAVGSLTTCGQLEKTSVSVEDFPVKTSASTATKKEVFPESAADYGLSSQGYLMKYDQQSASWKTPQLLLFEDWTECLPALPNWGTMRNGALYPHQKPVSKMCGENAGGYWGTIPSSTQWMRLKKESLTKCKFEAWHRTIICKIMKLHNCYPTPLLCEKLMGFPDGWSDLEPLETLKFHKWLHSQKEF